MPLGTPARLIRKERPDGSPLKVREFVSHDSRPRFGSLNHAYLGVRNAELQSEMAPIADMLQISQKTTRMTRNGYPAAKKAPLVMIRTPYSQTMDTEVRDDRYPF